MKQINILLAIIFLFLFSCEKNQNHSSSALKDMDGEVISHSTCKSFKTGSPGENISDTMSCVQYVYIESTKTLKLKHINAGFNCCPDSLYCNVTLNKDTIIVEEHEIHALCNCNCLFDLDIVIKNCPAKMYKIKIIEPYSQNQKSLFHTIDLSANPTGTYCVKRTKYPWGMQ